MGLSREEMVTLNRKLSFVLERHVDPLMSRGSVVMLMICQPGKPSTGVMVGNMSHGDVAAVNDHLLGAPAVTGSGSQPATGPTTA